MNDLMVDCLAVGLPLTCPIKGSYTVNG